MRIAIVNDARSQLQGTKTLWDDLVEWLGAEFVGDVPFEQLAAKASAHPCDIIIRNGSFFGPIETTAKQVSLIQDIFDKGPQRVTQFGVLDCSTAVVFNSEFTKSAYKDPGLGERPWNTQLIPQSHIFLNPPASRCSPSHLPIAGAHTEASVIPLSVDFSLFEPGNAMGLQQALSLPGGCVCWIGACQGPAAEIKGYDIFISIVRRNPDIPFVAVLKDVMPADMPPNMRAYAKVTHSELVKIIGACRVGLCTSRRESQHLAGIEMGACGLPIVAPPVGVYWNRSDVPGFVVSDPPELAAYISALRACLSQPGDPQMIRAYWRKEFDRSIIKQKWQDLIKVISCSGQS